MAERNDDSINSYCEFVVKDKTNKTAILKIDCLRTETKWTGQQNIGSGIWLFTIYKQCVSYYFIFVLACIKALEIELSRSENLHVFDVMDRDFSTRKSHHSFKWEKPCAVYRKRSQHRYSKSFKKCSIPFLPIFDDGALDGWLVLSIGKRLWLD